MTTKPKAVGLDTRAASKPTDCCNFTATRIMALIVRLALRGWLSRKQAMWLIQRGGLRND